MFKWAKAVFGGNQAMSGVEGLAALLNGQRGPGGIENFAAMLNGMGEAGGGKLAELFNNMNEGGGGNYAGFLNQATAAESQEFSRWVEGASSDEIKRVAELFNRPNSCDPRRVMSLIRSMGAAPSTTRKSRAVPAYSDVKQAVVQGNAGAVLAFLSDGFDVNSRNEHGETMLLHALCMGDARLAIAEQLVAHGANVNAAVHGKTLLKFIRNPTYCDNERTIAFLLREGATEGSESNRDSQPPPRTAKPATEAEMIRFQCAACTQRLKVVGHGVGKPIQCPKCGHHMRVPGTGTPEKPQASNSSPPPQRRDNTGSDGRSPLERLAEATGAVRLVQNPGLGNGSVLHVGVLVFREGESPPPDGEQYCRDVAKLKYGRPPDHLEAFYCVGVRPGAGLDYAYALGLYGRLRETGRLPDLGDLKDRFVGRGPDGQEIVTLFFCS